MSRVDRGRLDRALDGFAALSVAGWGVSVLVHDPGPPWLVRIAIAALDLAVAILFLTRGAALAHAEPLDVLATLPSIVVGALAVKLAPAAWPLASELGLALGAALAILSLATLGRSFAVLPARRALVVRGPYAWLRHPAYASELVMTVAAGAAIAWWAALGVGVLAALTLAPRIAREERVLARDPEWRAYASGVRWRLIPGIW